MTIDKTVFICVHITYTYVYTLYPCPPKKKNRIVDKRFVSFSFHSQTLCSLLNRILPKWLRYLLYNFLCHRYFRLLNKRFSKWTIRALWITQPLFRAVFFPFATIQTIALQIFLCEMTLSQAYKTFWFIQPMQNVQKPLGFYDAQFYKPFWHAVGHKKCVWYTIK